MRGATPSRPQYVLTAWYAVKRKETFAVHVLRGFSRYKYTDALGNIKIQKAPLTNSLEASSHSASQETPPSFMKPQGSLLCSQEPATGTYPEPDESSPHYPILFY
jgi:hypothetical protein